VRGARPPQVGEDGVGIASLGGQPPGDVQPSCIFAAIAQATTSVSKLMPMAASAQVDTHDKSLDRLDHGVSDERGLR
jgi:hypothetical protein